jgi:probable HAF family extracellular repeat protein
MLACYEYDAGFDNSVPYAFLWSKGVITPFVYQGERMSEFDGINNAGEIVGGGGAPIFHAILVSGGKVTDLAAVTGGRMADAHAINNRSQIAGDTIDSKPCIYTGGQLHVIPTVKGFPTGSASAINDAGEMAGWIARQGRYGETKHAFMTVGGSARDIGVLGNFTNSLATGINRQGQVVGYLSDDSSASEHAFVYANGVMSDIGTLAGGSWSQASGINDAGDVVGTSMVEFNPWGSIHGFIRTGGVMYDLNDLIFSTTEVTIAQALAINDSGVISASDDPNFRGNLYLLWPMRPGTPVPRLSVAGGSRIVVHRSRAFLHGRASGSVVSVTYSTDQRPSIKFATGDRAWSCRLNFHPGPNIVTLVAHGQGGDSQPYTVTVIRR